MREPSRPLLGTPRGAHHVHGLDAKQGEVIGLIGPNGAGKSTTLRALAGLVTITSGQIELDGRVLSGPGQHVPSHERNVGFVFQDHLLFPHLSALDNVAFGPVHADSAREPRASEPATGWSDSTCRPTLTASLASSLAVRLSG